MSAIHEDTNADGAVALVQPNQLSFTVVSNTDAQPLAKRFSLNEQGELVTSTTATLVEGTARIKRVSSITEFSARLDRLETHQALLFGIPASMTARIVTRERFGQMSIEERTGVITRTQEHIQFAHAPGIAMMDFDAGGAPEQMVHVIGSAEQTRELLIRAVPELASAPMLWRPSSSSYLYRGTTEIHGLRGQRIYIPMARASDIPSLGALLYERLWLLGYGYVLVSKSGQLLDRTPLDRAVWQPERLDFAAGPICVAPLERRPAEAKVWNPSAPFFDAGRLSPLTPQDRRAIEVKRKSAESAVHGIARAARKEWARDRGKAIAARRGLDENEGISVAEEAAENLILRPDFILTTEDGNTVSVADLLAQPDVWHAARFRDPLEPEYRGDNRIAWANLRPVHGRPYLYSHAHGGARYTLANGRTTIRIVAGELPRIVDEAADLIRAEADIYQLKDQLVRVTEDGRLATLEPEWTADWIHRHAEVLKWRKVGNDWDWRPADLPPKYARTLLAKSGELGLPGLVAITGGPFLRPDGTVVDEPRYDEVAQILYWPTEQGTPSVRKQLTQAEAENALRQFWAPFKEFPFATDVDRGAALALAITAALRPGLPTAPGGVIESHDAGSGKTLFAQAIANLTGVPAIPQALAQHEEEIRKSLFAAARAATPAIFFDNVGRERVVDSSTLAMVLTSGTIADRILGESTYATVPWRAMILMTGNNIRIGGDLNRRLLRVRITPNVEHPWTRVFAFDPRAVTETNWMVLRVRAIELVLTARANGPLQLDAGSGYPEWDALVRATVVWIGKNLDIGVAFADPLQSLRSGYDDDPERDRLRRLLGAWYRAFGDSPKTVREVLSAIEAHVGFKVGGGESDLPQTPLEELDYVLKEIDRFSGAHAIGIYLDQQKGRIVDGLELVPAGKERGSRRWTVRPIGKTST